MSFSDDHASPAAPFSGDETGDIFNAPDLVLSSPTTAERIVDTQSGFLVVVRRLEGRQALMVRRRLGTPPSSFVVLTPDESIKLSRILAGGWAEVPQGAAQPAENRLEEFQELIGQRRAAALASDLICSGQTRRSLKPTPRVLASVGLGWAVLLVGGLIGYSLEHFRSAQPKPASVAKAPDPLDAAKVDEFVRRFVAEMLDFNPDTYRVSQIRAMAVMSPELVETYWKDTRFPLSSRQLSSLPHDTTLMITRLLQKRPAQGQVEADVFAQMVQTGSKVGTPVHLRLKLGLEQGELRVFEQEDLSGAQ